MNERVYIIIAPRPVKAVCKVLFRYMKGRPNIRNEYFVKILGIYDMDYQRVFAKSEFDKE